MRKAKTGIAAVFSVVSTILYFASHIVAAIAIFKHVKLWLFLAALLVPGIGDIASMVILIMSKSYLPFILYGACIVCFIISGVIAKKADDEL